MTDTATNTAVKSGYAPVNGLQMYYEIHGTGQTLILIHGAFSATETSFGKLLPALAENRQVISVELQGHGHTADVDRPLTIDQLAEDTAALLRYIGIEKADIFGYSVGSAVAMQIASTHPDQVRKLILASASYTVAGLHPDLLEGIGQLQPEHLAGSPFQLEYASIAPRPEDWPTLVEKVKELDAHIADWPTEKFQGITAPTLLVIGDSDIIQPEHAVEMFRLLGGGVVGDTVGLPNSQLAILPGTTHVTLVWQADLLIPMITKFLDAPMPEAK